MNTFVSIVSFMPARCLGAVAGAILLAGGIHPVYAEGEVPAKVAGKEYVLARTSSFDAPAADSRNPFWPIGWVPGPAITQNQVAVYDVRPESFTLTTTSVDYPPLAIINGRSYAVGDAVPVAAAPQELVRVKKIMDGMVILDNRGRELKIMPGTAPKPQK